MIRQTMIRQAKIRQTMARLTMIRLSTGRHPLMPRLRDFLRPLVLAAVAIANLGCSDSMQTSEQSGGLTAASELVSTSPYSDSSQLILKAPAVLEQARNVDRNQLSPEVRINDELQSGALQRVEDALWQGTIQVPASANVRVLITWFENLEGQQLALASYAETLRTNTSAAQVTLTLDDYNTQIDTDNDGSSNLAERIALTNPFDATSTPAPSPDPANVVLQLPRINGGSVPQIDGNGAAYDANELVLVGEWAAANNAVGQGNGDTDTERFVDNLMISRSNGGESEPFHTWAGMHDGNFLYLLVLVDDLAATQGDSANIADDDSIEIYIDGNNSNLNSYGDEDDRYFRVALTGSDGNANTSTSMARRIQQGERSAGIPDNIEFATGIGTGPLSVSGGGQRHDIYELKLELASFGIVVGEPFGLEVQLNDDDDGGSRDSKWGWAHPIRRASDIDFTINNPAFMATITLQN